MDLLTPVVPTERFHPNFARILQVATLEERQLLEAWSRTLVDRDGKFVIEFQTTFNSSFWELYLAALFADSSAVVDYSHSRPDFVVTSGGLGAFCAEAVIASNPQGGVPQWANKLEEEPPPREVLLDLAMQRLAQAVREKQQKYLKGYAKLAQCIGVPYIVCVAPFEQPWGFLQGTEAIDRVLFGGKTPVTVTDDNGVERVVGIASTPESFKPSGAAIPVGLFGDPAYADISAVFFSSVATWSKLRGMATPKSANLVFRYIRWFEREGMVEQSSPGAEYVETLVDGAHLFLNPNARLSVDPEPWWSRGVAIHQVSPHGTMSLVPEGCLLSRLCLEIRAPDAPPLSIEDHEAPRDSTPHRRLAAPDGVFYGGPTRVTTFDVELMLHRGWTVYVGRDLVDGDWCVMVKPEVWNSVPEFLNAKHEPWMGPFVETKEEAAKRGTDYIDQSISTAR